MLVEIFGWMLHKFHVVAWNHPWYTLLWALRVAIGVRMAFMPYYLIPVKVSQIWGNFLMIASLYDLENIPWIIVHTIAHDCLSTFSTARICTNIPCNWSYDGDTKRASYMHDCSLLKFQLCIQWFIPHSSIRSQFWNFHKFHMQDNEWMCTCPTCLFLAKFIVLTLLWQMRTKL